MNGSRVVSRVSIDMHIKGSLSTVGHGNDVVFDDLNDTALIDRCILQNFLGFRLSIVDLKQWLIGKCVVITKSWVTERGCSSVSWARWVMDLESVVYVSEMDAFVVKNLKLGGMT